ncbi:putative hydrolase [Bradyrhizobium lupini HPC(L)]|uniref:Hydrolase n=1 Tax=Bradyrhizobium lupini HPC(L) TaxID=1229491 RepID=A0ABP2RQE7_RHILU|nr:putative hydrolase [Bradyrhizobium lupini HPC(L)]
MAFYHTDRVEPHHREKVRALLPGLETVTGKSAERIVEAWSIMWASSAFERLEDVPVSPGLTCSLIDHTNDVVTMGRAIAAAFCARDKFIFDASALDAALFLHDIDKLLMFRHAADGIERSPVSRQIPHGVLAGMLLSEMGFSEKVISIVTTHATDAPFHVESPEALVMHYADMASIDRVRMKEKVNTFYALR